MSQLMQFNENLSQIIVRLYQTGDVEAQRQKTLDLLRLQAGESVLDIGSGPGFLAKQMAEIVGNTGQVTGIDISDDMLSISEPFAAEYPHLRFEKANADNLPFEDASFDVAVSTQVYEYVSNIESSLSELYRILRPGGRALILDTDWESCVWQTDNRDRMHRIIDAYNRHCPHPHLPRTLGKLLQNTGFTITTRTIFPMYNPEFVEHSYGNYTRDFIATYVRGQGVIPAEEIDAWYREQDDLAANGRYFFSLNRYVFMVGK